MGRPLLRKLLFGYTLIAIVSLILVNTLGIRYLSKQLITERKTQLSSYNKYICDQHFDTAIDTNTIYSLKSISRQIANTDSILGTRTWIVDSKGFLVLDSGNEDLQQHTYCILDHNATYFQHYYYIGNSIENLLPDPMLTVILPISENYTIRGYIVTHYPMSQLTYTVQKYQYTANFLILLVLFFFAIGSFFIWYNFILPTQKLLSYSSQINDGNYDTNLVLSSKDEYAKLALEFSYMAEKIQHLDEYQKNFIANVSHDFRSPLTSIKGYAEAMADGTIPPEMNEKYLNVIVFEAERLTKLTTNLLSLNQFEQGRQRLDITSFDINVVLKQVCASFEGTCISKHIKLKLTFAEIETYVDADKERIQQVLYNLIDNAIKFSHKDSEIWITTREKREKVQISVKDFGIGIPKDGIKKIWDRFYKTDLSRGKDKKGTGLGLSITKEILASHNETIQVVSTEGAGTEFTFTLLLTTPNEI